MINSTSNLAARERVADLSRVADPFVHTEAAVALLRPRPKPASSRRLRRRRRFILRPRFA
jgi:hypothetical protein